MKYVIIPPCEELKHFVSHFWAGYLDASEQTNFIYYSTANTQTEVAFAYKPPYNAQPELLFSSVLGHTERAGQLPAGGFMEIMGASVFSHAAPLFFDVSASDMTNQFTDVYTLLGIQGPIITEKMAHAMTLEERVRILTEYFKAQVRKRRIEDPVIARAIQLIRKQHGIMNVSQLASEFCLSQKQFERRFTAYSGFKPKLYSQIIRFESACWNCRNHETLTMAAHTYGYYDQAHFIHDFKRFSGFSPNKFFSLAGY
jgi:AraC-like DNA-binding protein